MVTVESSVSARCTSIHASDGSSERTITQSTTAKNSAENFTARCSVATDVNRRLYESTRAEGAGPLLLTTFGEQLSDEGAIGLAVPVGRADHLLPDDTVASDDERLWYTGGLVIVRDLAGGVVKNLERESELLHERTNLVRRPGVIHAHRDDLETLRRQRLVQLLDGGHLIATREAERSPDVEEHHLTLVVVEGVRTRHGVHGLRAEVRRLRAHGHRIQLIFEQP